MRNNPVSLFISDIHLSESRSDIVAAFFAFIENIAPTADKLYILGDLFDFWAGDDIETALTKSVAEALTALTGKGVEIIFIPGNRDFALGKAYAQQANMQLVGDSLKIENGTILLIHGDELCVDDLKYQRYKKWIRHPLILGLLKNIPRRYRIKLANKIRTQSKNSAQKAIVDVTPAYVDQLFVENNLTMIIHGHTHRAGYHKHLDHYERYVLSDWDQKGDYLRLENGVLRRHIFRIDPFTRIS